MTIPIILFLSFKEVYVTVNGVNSNIGAEKIKNNMRKYRKKAWIDEV